MAEILQLAGQVAGIGGVALIVFLTIAKGIMGKTITVNQSQSFKLLNTLLWLAAIITVLGIFAYIASIYIRESEQTRRTTFEAKQKKESDKTVEAATLAVSKLGENQAIMRTTIEFSTKDLALAAEPLSDLKIEWTFTTPPPWFDDLKILAYSALERWYYSEDDLAAFGPVIQNPLRNSLKIDYELNATVVGIAEDTKNIKQYYDGNISDALKAKGKGSTDDINDFQIRYKGPRYEVLIPLTEDWTEIVSLGKKTDDHGDEKTIDAGREKQIFDLTRHKFDICIEGDDALKIVWHYPKISLNRIVNRQDIKGLLPSKFNILLVHGEMDKEQYQNYLKEHFSDFKGQNLENDWSSKSKLEITINGHEDRKLIYSVARKTTEEFSRRIFEDEYAFRLKGSTFTCERIK